MVVGRLKRFLARHKRGEEVAAEALGLDLLWTVFRWAGLFGAGVAAAAVASSLSTSPVHLSPGRSLGDYVYSVAPHYGIDPAAALAVSTQEGGGGGIGDSGTSFGPWQLHYGGALPSGVYHGPYSPVTQAWAWSSSGVNYALRQMGGVCRGLRSYAAVSCIVARFERSARVAAETAGAWRAYGFFHPTRRLTRAERLRRRRGYHSWVDWSLAVGPWKGYRRWNPHVRPHVRRHVPKSWWHRRALYARQHHL